MSRRESRPSKTLGAAVAGLLLCVLLSSCAVGQAFGIDLTAASTPEEVKVLARKAQGGDKLAQLELGKRFEAGRDVPKDLARAAKLYAAAAAPIDGASIRTLYTPNGGVSTTVLNGGGAGGGLPYAAVRECALAGASDPEGRCADLAGVDELLIFISYETNFSACATQAGFATWAPNPYRDVQKCLVAKAEAISCDAVLAAPLLRAKGMADLDRRFAGLESAADNLRAFCGLRSSASAEEIGKAMAQGVQLTPIDALVDVELGRRRPYYNAYAADHFLVLMCRLTPRDLGLKLSNLEKSMCAVAVPREGKS